MFYDTAYSFDHLAQHKVTVHASFPTPTIDQIIKATAREFNFPLVALFGQNRKREFVVARWAAMHIASLMTGKSLPVLGRAFGRDHTTILHGLRQADVILGGGIGSEKYDCDDFKARINRIITAVRGVAI